MLFFKNKKETQEQTAPQPIKKKKDYGKVEVVPFVKYTCIYSNKIFEFVVMKKINEKYIQIVTLPYNNVTTMTLSRFSLLHKQHTIERVENFKFDSYKSSP